MKIGSLNVRELWSDAKKEDVTNFFSKNYLEFCCLQKTEMDTLPGREGRFIWKAKEVRWSTEGVLGRSGRILTCWNERKFTCISTWNLREAVVVNGWWRATREEYSIINVCAPCNRVEKGRLWDRGLGCRVGGGCESMYYRRFLILDEGERVGLRCRVWSRETLEFKEFIEKNGLIDVDLQRRKYTWYKSNETCKSRINRALINEK